MATSRESWTGSENQIYWENESHLLAKTSLIGKEPCLQSMPSQAFGNQNPSKDGEFREFQDVVPYKICANARARNNLFGP